MSRKNLMELGADLFFGIFGIVVMAYSFLPQRAIVTIGDGIKSMTVPRIVIGLLLFLVLLDFIGVILRIKKNKIASKISRDAIDPNNVKKIITTLGVMVIYVILWNIIGFTLSTILVIFVETKIVNRDIPSKKILVFGIAFTVLVLVIFGGLFAMDFPEPILEMIRGY